MHTPPPPWFYYQVWLFPVAGAACVIAAPVDREWRFLGLGFALLAVGILGIALCAWMRERFNRWHPDGRGLVDERDHPVTRSQLWSDAIGARAIRLVRPTFGSDS